MLNIPRSNRLFVCVASKNPGPGDRCYCSCTPRGISERWFEIGKVKMQHMCILLDNCTLWLRYATSVGYRLSLVTASVCIAPGELTDSIPALHSSCSCSSKALLAPRRIRYLTYPGLFSARRRPLRSCAKVGIRQADHINSAI
jgi:hypothetical protein